MARRGQLWPQPERNVGIASTAAAAPDPAWGWSSGLITFSNAIQRVVSDWADIAERGVYKALADRERAKPVARDENGNIVFELPNVDALSRYGLVVREAAAQRYVDALTLDTDKHLAELHGQFRFDPDNFAVAATAYVDRVAETAPPEVAAGYRESAYRRIAEHVRSIALARIDRDTREARASLSQVVERASTSVARAIASGSNDSEAATFALARIRAAVESGIITPSEAERLERRITVLAPVMGTIQTLARKNDFLGLLDLARAAEVGSEKFEILDDDERAEVVKSASAAARTINAVIEARREEARRAAQEKLWRLRVEYASRLRNGEIDKAQLANFADRALAIASRSDVSVPGALEFFESINAQLLARERASSLISNPVVALATRLEDDLTFGRALAPGEFEAVRTVIETIPAMIEHGERDGSYSQDEIKALREARQQLRELYHRHQRLVFSRIEDAIKKIEATHGPATQPIAIDQFLRGLEVWRGVFAPDATGSDPIDSLRETVWRSNAVAQSEQNVRAINALSERLRAASERGDLDEARAVYGELLVLLPVASDLVRRVRDRAPSGTRIASEFSAAVSRFETEALRAIERGMSSPGYAPSQIRTIMEHSERISDLLRGLERAVAERNFSEAERIRSEIRSAIDDPNVQGMLETIATVQTQKMQSERERLATELQDAWDRVRLAYERGDAPRADDAAALDRALEAASSFSKFFADRQLSTSVANIRSALSQHAKKMIETEAKASVAMSRAIELLERLQKLGVSEDDPRIRAISQLPPAERADELERMLTRLERRAHLTESQRRAVATARASGVPDDQIEAALDSPTVEISISRLDELAREYAEENRRAKSSAVSRWARRLDEIDALMNDAENGARFVAPWRWPEISAELAAIENMADELEANDISRRAALLRRIAGDFVDGLRGVVSKSEIASTAIAIDEGFGAIQRSLVTGQRLSDDELARLASIAAKGRAIGSISKNSELVARAVRLSTELAAYDSAIARRENDEVSSWNAIAAMNEGLAKIGRSFDAEDLAIMARLSPDERTRHARKIYDEAIAFWNISGQVADYLRVLSEYESVTPKIAELRDEVERALLEPDAKVMLDRLDAVTRQAKALAQAAIEAAGTRAEARRTLRDHISGIPASPDRLRSAVEALLSEAEPVDPEQRVSDFALALSAGGDATGLALARVAQAAADPSAVQSGAALDALSLLRVALTSDRRAAASVAMRAQSDTLASLALAMAFTPSIAHAELFSRFVSWVNSGMPQLPQEFARVAAERAEEVLQESVDPSILSSLIGTRGEDRPAFTAMVRGIARGLALLFGDAPTKRQIADTIGSAATAMVVDNDRIGWSTTTLPPEFFLGVRGQQIEGGLLPKFRQQRMLVQYPVERWAIDVPSFGEAAKILGVGPMPGPVDWLEHTIMVSIRHWMFAMQSNGALAPFGWNQSYLVQMLDAPTFLPIDPRLGRDVFMVPVDGTNGRVYNVRVRTADGYFVLAQRPTEDGSGWVPLAIDVGALHGRVVEALRRAQIELANLGPVDLSSVERENIIARYRNEIRKILTPPWVELSE